MTTLSLINWQQQLLLGSRSLSRGPKSKVKHFSMTLPCTWARNFRQVSQNLPVRKWKPRREAPTFFGIGASPQSTSYSNLPERLREGNIPSWVLAGVGIFFCAAIYGIFGVTKEEEDDGDGSSVSPSIKRQLLKANRALKRRNYVRAEKACHQAMALLANSKHAQRQPYIEASAIVMDKLANIYLEQRKWTEAEMLFKETLRVMFSVGVHKDDAAVIEISLKLAKIYHNKKRYDEAEVGFDWCVDTARDKWKEDKDKERYALFGMCLQSRAQFHQLVGRYDTAIRDFTEVLDVAEVVYGAHHLQVAVSYNNLATAVDASHDYKRAIDLVSKCLEMIEDLLREPPSQSQDEDPYSEADLEYYRAVFLVNKGTIHVNNGEYALATPLYDEVGAFAKKRSDEQLLGEVKRGRQKIEQFQKKHVTRE